MATDFSSQATPIPQAQFNQPVVVGDKYVNLSASAQIKASQGWLAGIFVNSGSSPTIKLTEKTSGGSLICNTFTPTIGWNPCPIPFVTGLYATIGGTADVTFIYV